MSKPVRKPSMNEILVWIEKLNENGFSPTDFNEQSVHLGAYWAACAILAELDRIDGMDLSVDEFSKKIDDFRERLHTVVTADNAWGQKS